MPRGCSDDDLPWGKGNSNKLDNKYMYGKLKENFCLILKKYFLRVVCSTLEFLL